MKSCQSKAWMASLFAILPLALAATLFITCVVQAEEILPEILVTASRFEESSNHVPANVKIISREDIENSSSNNIPEVLSQLGGLVISGTSLGQFGLGASVDMGGYGATANSTTLILLDGQRLNPIDSSSVSWESIPLGSIQRIEILRGGASVQYGNGAVGGVINVITRNGVNKINEVTVKAGSFGTLMTNGVLNLGSENTSLRLNANTANTNGWRENSAANLYSFGGKLTEFLSGPNSIYLGVNASHSNAHAAGGVLGEVGQGNPQLAKFNNVGSANGVDNSSVWLGDAQSLNGLLTFEGEAMYSSRTSNFYQPYYSTSAASSAGFASPTNNNLQSWSWNLTPRIKADWGKCGTTVVGFDINKSSEGTNDEYSTGAQQNLITFGATRMNDSGNATLLSHSPYILERFPLNPSVEVSGGFRHQTQSASAYDANAYSVSTIIASKVYSANAADLAFNFSYLDGQKTFMKWNQSFRFPNIDEFWGWDSSYSNRIFNGILQPQISRMIELGGEWHFWNSRLTASIFHSNSHNEISLASSGANVNEPFDILRKGVMFDSTSHATSNLTVSAGGKLQKSTYAGGPNTGNTISLVPDLTLNAKINYSLGGRWSLGGVVMYTGSQYYDGDKNNSLDKMPSSTVMDVYSSYQSGPWNARFTIKNLANKNYATNGGYSSFVSLSDGSYIPSYYYYPSDPRAYYLTMKYAF